MKGHKLSPYLGTINDQETLLLALGYAQGDGCLTTVSKLKNMFEVYIGDQDQDVLSMMKRIGLRIDNTPWNQKAYYIYGINDELKKMGFSLTTLPEREFPQSYQLWTPEEKMQFLKGCYSANGCVIKNARVSYKTTCKNFAEQLVTALKGFDITAYITTNKPSNVEFENGTFTCRQSYDVNIHQFPSIQRFSLLIGFIQEYKKEALRKLIIKRNPVITSIKKGTVQKVYDFTEPDEHWGIVNGMIAHNCAEFNSIPYTSCCLGSFNLMKYINEGMGCIDTTIQRIGKDIETAVRMLDNVISVNKYPLDRIRDMTQANRSIGIGIMGFADALYKLGISYGSDESIKMLGQTASNITLQAQNYSRKLAEERGVYLHFEGSTWHSYGLSMRNSDVTSIAPTGSISTICGVSSSIEPNFGLVYTRETVEGHRFHIVNPIFKEWLDDRGLYSDDLLEKISQNHGSCHGIKEIPVSTQMVFTTAHDLTPHTHIQMTAAVQKNISLSVSKTVNLPNSATVEDVEKTYMEAYESGLLGITIYRDGCRDSQVLSTGATYKDAAPATDEPPLHWGDIIETNDHVVGRKRKVRTACGNLHVSAYFDPETGRLLELFTNRGGQGGCTALQSAVSRLISRCLRLGDTPEAIAEQLQSTLQCPHWNSANQRRRYAGHEPLHTGFSCASAIGKAILTMRDEINKGASDAMEGQAKPCTEKKVATTPGRPCPECGAELSSDGGCMTCVACGWSRCG